MISTYSHYAKLRIIYIAYSEQVHHPLIRTQKQMSNHFFWKWREAGQSSSSSSSAGGDDLVGKDSTAWSAVQRTYTCTFCRRVFRSAQALGGHMNIHRRERARLQLQQRSSSIKTTCASPFFPVLGQPFLSNPVVKGLKLGSHEDHREPFGVPNPSSESEGICIQQSSGGKTGSLNNNNNNVQVLDLELRLWW